MPKGPADGDTWGARVGLAELPVGVGRPLRDDDATVMVAGNAVPHAAVIDNSMTRVTARIQVAR